MADTLTRYATLPEPAATQEWIRRGFTSDVPPQGVGRRRSSLLDFHHLTRQDEAARAFRKANPAADMDDWHRFLSGEVDQYAAPRAREED